MAYGFDNYRPTGNSGMGGGYNPGMQYAGGGGGFNEAAVAQQFGTGGPAQQGPIDNGMLGQTLQNRGYDPQQLRDAQFGQALQNRGGLQTRQQNPINAGGITTTQPGMIPLTGLLGSEQALSQSLAGGLNFLNGGRSSYSGGGGGGGAGGGGSMASSRMGAGGSGGSINRQGQYGDIQNSLGAYTGQGQSAMGLQGALSGMNGQQAFDDAFVDSPVQAFLREQGDRALTRNASAVGGLGGGGVRKELARFGQGLAGTQLQQQIDNLSSISNQGLSSGIAQGSLLGNIEGIEANRFGAQAGMANARTGAAASRANTRDNINFNRDNAMAQAMFGTGTNMAQGRMNVGAGMSGNINNTTSALADLQNNQGTGFSNIIGTGGNNIAGIQQGLGNLNAASQQELGTTLGNWNQGASGQVSGLPGVGQFQGNELQNFGNIASGIGTGLQAYNNYNQSQAPANAQPAWVPTQDTQQYNYGTAPGGYGVA